MRGTRMRRIIPSMRPGQVQGEVPRKVRGFSIYDNYKVSRISNKNQMFRRNLYLTHLSAYWLRYRNVFCRFL